MFQGTLISRHYLSPSTNISYKPSGRSFSYQNINIIWISFEFLFRKIWVPIWWILCISLWKKFLNTDVAVSPKRFVHIYQYKRYNSPEIHHQILSPPFFFSNFLATFRSSISCSVRHTSDQPGRNTHSNSNNNNNNNLPP
jgi:hypothetical protein